MTTFPEVRHRTLTPLDLYHHQSRSDAAGNSNLIVLPPCAICGNKSSGWHYGANTCESCKQFFRRSMSRKKSHTCYRMHNQNRNRNQNDVHNQKNNQNCEIFPNKKNCPSCRLVKCINVGMSTHSISRGRYTLEKRNRNIEAVNMMELQRKMKSNGSVCREVERTKEMTNMIEELSAEMFTNLTIHRTSVIEKALKVEQNFIEERRLRKKLFGPMQPLSKDEYDIMYKATGLDVDDRRMMMRSIVDYTNQHPLSFMQFCEVIPGFKSLHPNDRQNIINRAFFDCFIMLFAWHYNADDGTWIHPLNETLVFSKESSKSLTNDQGGHENFWRIMRRVQDLDLTFEERVIAASLCLTLSDVDISVQGRKTLNACADYLMEALDHLTSTYHGREQHVLAKLIAIICDCRNPWFRNYFNALNDVFKEALDPAQRLEDVLLAAFTTSK